MSDNVRGVCFGCRGRGWVRNGEIEDGRMTGRVRCRVCDGDRVIPEAALEAHIARLKAQFYGEEW